VRPLRRSRRRVFLTCFAPGPGANTSSRVPIEHILTAEQAADFTVAKVFLEQPKWIDYGYLY
jgi:hypothetical protein